MQSSENEHSITIAALGGDDKIIGHQTKNLILISQVGTSILLYSLAFTLSEINIHTHPIMVIGNSKGGGVQYEANLEFPEGWGFKPKNLLWRTCGYLLEQHIPCLV